MTKNNNIKISIIIPCYNAQNFINGIGQMLANQTFDEYEVIMINDGSSDNTEQLIKEIQKENKRIKLISIPYNIGTGNARNIGMQHAKGKYLLFLDADDFYYENLLEEAYKTAEETDVDIVLFKSHIYDAFKNKIFTADLGWLWSKPYPVNKIFKPDDIKEHLFMFCRGVPWNKLFKRSFVEKNKLFFINIPRHNDSYFVYTAYVLAKSMFVKDTSLITYTVNRTDSISNIVKDDISYREINAVLLKKFLESKNLLPKYGAALEEFIING